MDLLHAYSKQLGDTPPVQGLVDRARESKRWVGSTAARKRARQLRPEDLETLIAHYRENGSVAAAAKPVDITRQSAAGYLSEAGLVTIRRMIEENIARARASHEAGISMQEGRPPGRPSCSH